MRKWLILLALALLSVVVAVPTVPALAQGDPWTCTYDFAEGSGGFFSISDAAYSDGKWHSSLSGPFFDAMGMGLTFAETDITSIHVEGFIAANRGDADEELYFGDGTPFNGIADYDLTDSGGVAFDETDTTLRSDVTQLWFYFTTTAPANDSYYALIELEGEGDSPCETTAYVRPVAAADLDALVENPNVGPAETDSTVFAVANQQSASVYAAADGTVTEMRPAEPDDCAPNIGTVDPPLFGEPAFCSLLLPGDGATYYLDGMRDGAIAGNTWLLRLFADDGNELTYLLASPELYVTEGQSVTAGCVIGRTMLVDNGETPPNYVSGTGLAIVAVREAGTISDSLDFFTLEPDSSTPCNQQPENENCLGDVQLNDPSQWESSAGVIWNSPGVRLLPDLAARIRTTMNLDPAQKPELIVRARASGGGNGNVELTLGQTTLDFSVSESAGYQDLIIAGDFHVADGTFYTVRVTNNGTSTIDVQSICVRFTDDGEGGEIDNPDPPPPPCIFANNSFNDGTTGWFVTGTEPGPGELRVASGGTFYQNVTVPAGTYDLTVVAAIWSYNSFVPDDQDSDDVDIEYDFGAGSVTLDSHTYGEFAQNNNVVVFSTALVVASETTDDFLFEVTLNSPATGVRGLAIRSVCIGDEGTGESGGGDGGDGDGGLFEPNCSGDIATPSGSDIGAWIGWHWSQSNKFFRCELIILLNDLFKFLQKSWITVTWSMRWSQAATVKTVNWFGRDFVGWLGGHLSNIAVGTVVTINNSEGAEQCGNLFCLLRSIGDGIAGIANNIVDGLRAVLEQVIGALYDLLSVALNAIIAILQQILSFVFSIVGTIISLAVKIVSFMMALLIRVADLVNMAIRLTVMLLSLWVSATPIDPGGILTACALDQTSARCMLFYITERTVFTESGAHFVSVFAAWIYGMTFVSVIRRVKAILTSLGVLS